MRKNKRRIFGVWVAALVGALLPAVSPAAEERVAVLAPPVEIAVETGAEAQFELRALFTGRHGLFGGGAMRETEFVLVVPPRFGSIQDLRQLPRTGDRDSATAVYRHNRDAGGFVDGAEFELRDVRDGTVLARVAVTMKILRALLDVEPRGRLWLGECVIGDRADGVITFENKGGAALSFRVAAWRPFFVEGGAREMYLAPGAKLPVTFSFEPEAPGFFESPLILKPELIPNYTIEAKAIEAVALSTNYADFGAINIGSEAVRVVSVRNRSRSSRDIEIQLSGPFVAAPMRSRVPALGGVEVSVTCRPTTTGPASGWLVVQEGRSIHRCQLAGHARLGPILSVVGGSVLDLGVITGLNATAFQSVLLTNRGDAAWDGAAKGTSIFGPSLSSFRVEPFGSHAVEIHYRPTSFGAHTGLVLFEGQTTAGVTVVAASVTPSAVAPPQPSPGGYAALPLPEPSGGTNANAGRPMGAGAKVPESGLISVPRFDLEKLPSFEPTNFRASVAGEGLILIEWDPSPDLPLERLDIYEGRFQRLRGRTAGMVWTRRPEVPRLSADGKTASIATRKLPEGGQFQFLIAQVNSEGRPVKRTPIIDVETPAKQVRGVPWRAIIITACTALIILHFFGPRLLRLISRR